jgi:hypothetical protein
LVSGDSTVAPEPALYRSLWDLDICKQCFETNSNARWVKSTKDPNTKCDAKEICEGRQDGRDCDIWPKVEVAAGPASSAAAATAAAVNTLEICVNSDCSDYRGY